MPTFFITASRAFLSLAERTNNFLDCTDDSDDSESFFFMKGAFSSTTCAFVPPKPKLLTLAKRFGRGQGR